MSCKYCKEEFCVNDACPVRGDYCPVVDYPNVCRYEAVEPLERFLAAQSETYEIALAEIKEGHKETHWMWWIFPQYKGLGTSDISKHYAIQSREEAKAYWEHPVLGYRLRECIDALLDLETDDVEEIFGLIDAIKLKACMTLFYFHGGQVLCGKVLDEFFLGDLDLATVSLLLEE